MDINFELNPSDADVKLIYDGLDRYNEPIFGDMRFKNFACFLRDDKNIIFGGATGFILKNIAILKLLWIDEAFRGQG